jgi:hypothetical protein
VVGFWDEIVYTTTVKQLLTPNIDGRGRLARAGFGVIMVALGWVSLQWSVWAGGALLALGALGLFEALRGWCIVRACGIKTRM